MYSILSVFSSNRSINTCMQYECNFFVSLVAGTYWHCTYSDVVPFYVAWSMLFPHDYSIAYFLIFLYGLITSFLNLVDLFLLAHSFLDGYFFRQLRHVKDKWISVSSNTLLPLFLKTKFCISLQTVFFICGWIFLTWLYNKTCQEVLSWYLCK